MSFTQYIEDKKGSKLADLDNKTIYLGLMDYVKEKAQGLAKNTGKTKEQILKDTERDNYLSSEEAVNYGLIDSVFRR